MPTFEVKTPVGVNQVVLKQQIREAVAEATKRGKLRPNSVDSLTGENSGNNLGPGTPIIHFEQWEHDEIEVKLILKGGGCENMNAQVLAAGRTAASRPRRSHHRGRAQVHPARGVAGAGQGLCARRGRRGHRRRSHLGLRPRQGAALPHARRRQPRRPPGRARGRDHGHGEPPRRRHDGLRGPHLAHRLQGRRAEPPAGQLLRLGGLRLLGVPPAGRGARRDLRRDHALAIPRSGGAGAGDDGPGRHPPHRPRGGPDHAARRGDRPLAEGRRRGADERAAPTPAATPCTTT